MTYTNIREIIAEKVANHFLSRLIFSQVAKKFVKNPSFWQFLGKAIFPLGNIEIFLHEQMSQTDKLIKIPNWNISRPGFAYKERSRLGLEARSLTFGRCRFYWAFLNSWA